MFKFKQFSPKQLKLINWWVKGSPFEHWDGIIADGAIRSGKTIAMIVGFLKWSQASFEHTNFILAGKSVGALKRNVVFPMLAIMYVWGWTWTFNRSEGYLTIGTNTYYLFGANTEAAQDTLQGLTAGGALADEVALFPQSFVDQMFGRCSLDGAKVWCNCNPRSPFHYFKTEFIDKARAKKLLYLHFTMDDNWSLSQTVRDRFKRMFTGVFFKRYILGLWVRAEGVIYDMFNEERNVIPDEPRPYEEWYVSCDYGTQNPMVYLLWGKVAKRCKEKRLRGKWVCVKEYHYDGRETNRQKTDEEYYADLLEFVGTLPIQAVIIDPSAASFITTVRKHGKFVVRKGKNAVVTGIRRCAVALSAQQVFICDTCVEFIKEFYSYVWDEKAIERGLDEPLKQNDHAMDAFRYFVMTVLSSGMQVLK